MNTDEQAWQRGMVFNQPSKFQQPDFSDPECWDDSAILDVFDNAIRSHRTKGQQGGISGNSKKGGKPVPPAPKGTGVPPRKVAFDMPPSSAAGHPSSSSVSPAHLPHLQMQLDEAFNGMLMAWYHSGYATGRYQALLELSQHPQGPPAAEKPADTRTDL